jgi:hypothetical protein
MPVNFVCLLSPNASQSSGCQMNAPGTTPTSCVVFFQAAIDFLETNLDSPSMFGHATLGRYCLDINGVHLPMRVKFPSRFQYTDPTSPQVKEIQTPHPGIRLFHWLYYLGIVHPQARDHPYNCHIKMDRFPQFIASMVVHEKHHLPVNDLLPKAMSRFRYRRSFIQL